MKLLLVLFTFIYSPLNIANNTIDIESNEEVISHKRGHINPGGLTQSNDTKIGLIFPEISNQLMFYSCTKEVIIEARKILSERPNGSEVYYMFVDNVVWELKLCHEHNGEVIDCGKEL